MFDKLKSPKHAGQNYRDLMKMNIRDLGWLDPWCDPAYDIYIDGERFIFSLDHKACTCRPISYGDQDCVKSWWYYSWDKIAWADKCVHEKLNGIRDTTLMGMAEAYPWLNKSADRSWAR